MEGDMVALTVPDCEGGFNVIDSRDGEPIAWEASFGLASEIALYINSSYPRSALPPARDSLVFEVLIYRIWGEPVLSLRSALAIRRICRSCPDYLPVGPGWQAVA